MFSHNNEQNNRKRKSTTTTYYYNDNDNNNDNNQNHRNKKTTTTTYYNNNDNNNDNDNNQNHRNKKTTTTTYYFNNNNTNYNTNINNYNININCNNEFYDSQPDYYPDRKFKDNPYDYYAEDSNNIFVNSYVSDNCIQNNNYINHCIPNNEIQENLITFNLDYKKAPQINDSNFSRFEEDYNKIEPLIKSSDNCMLTGDHTKHYYNFLDYIINNQETNPDYTSLGAISPSKYYYFEDTPSVSNIAENFLDAFWASYYHRLIAMRHQLTKAQIKTNNGIEGIPPSCISFIEATIENKRFCLVALSGISGIYKNNPVLYLSLSNFIKKINAEQNIEFVLLKGSITNIGRIISHLADNKNLITYKHCSEKFYISCLTKLFLEYGNNLKIHGVVNCKFYPYMEGKSYGRRGKNLNDAAVTPPNAKTGMTNLKSGLQVAYITCCDHCVDSKAQALSILKAAQNAGMINQKEKMFSTQNYYATSPLRNSIETTTSLRENSLFSHNQQMHVNEEIESFKFISKK